MHVAGEDDKIPAREVGAERRLQTPGPRASQLEATNDVEGRLGTQRAENAARDRPSGIATDVGPIL